MRSVPFFGTYKNGNGRKSIPVFGAERGIRAFSGAPRSAIINGVLCRKHTICGKAFCSRKTALLAQARLSLRSVTLTPTYRRSLISSLQGVINALLNGQLVHRIPLFFSVHKKQEWTKIHSCFLARREGFEPPEALTSTVFKTAAIDHSTISAFFFSYYIPLKRKCQSFCTVFLYFSRSLHEKPRAPRGVLLCFIPRVGNVFFR